jgi:ribosomal protein S18 acetylase RimI-like enzyme
MKGDKNRKTLVTIPLVGFLFNQILQSKENTMSKVEVIVGDIQNEAHQKAMLEQLDSYRQDPMGGVGAMDKELADKVIEGLKKQPNYLFFLAYCDEELAGFANCFVNFSTFKAKQLINIHDIAVNPAFRGKGIGQSIMEAIAKHAKENGYCKINLEVRNDNPKAMQLYQSLGFTDCNPPMYFWEKVL